MPYVFLVLAIILEIVGTSVLPKTNGFKNLYPTLLCLLSYALTFYFLSLAVRTIPVGLVYAIWAGVGIVLIALVGYFILGQKLDFWAIVGILLILIGVILIKTLSKSI